MIVIAKEWKGIQQGKGVERCIDYREGGRPSRECVEKYVDDYQLGWIVVMSDAKLCKRFNRHTHMPTLDSKLLYIISQFIFAMCK